MTELPELINRVGYRPDCAVRPPTGLPHTSSGHQLPPDVKAFYLRCGGVDLWGQSDYAIRILKPEEVLEANPVIVGEQFPDDISSSWYTIAQTIDGDYITIDFAIERLGRCYDSYYENHGIVGSCRILATSFTSLFRMLVELDGGRFSWLEPDFHSFGDAYDTI